MKKIFNRATVFPFLIGKVLTEKAFVVDEVFNGLEVSIPYR